MPARRRRASVLILVLVVLCVCGALAFSFLSSQSTSAQLADTLHRRAQARHVAESGLAFAIQYVSDDPDWRTDQRDGTWVSDVSLGDGMFTIVGEDGVDTDGDGVVEGDDSLDDNHADPLTLAVTATVAGVSHTARAVVRTSFGSESYLLYGLAKNDTPMYRKYSPDGWSDEDPGNDLGGEPRWIVAAHSPVRTETAVCVLDQGKDVNLQFLSSGSWSAVSELTTNAQQDSERPFDIAYERQSGNLLIAYASEASQNLYWREWNGVSLSDENEYVLPTTDKLRFVRLVARPDSDEIMLLTLNDDKDVCAAIWNGNAWTNPVLLETKTKSAGDEGVHAAYESQSGRAVVAWADDSLSTFQFRTWDGDSWSAEADGPVLGSKDPRWIRLAADPLTDQVLLAALDSNKDVYTVAWDGSSWGTPLLLEPATPDSNSREFDIAYLRGSSQAIVVWGRSGSSNFHYRLWDGSAWSTEQDGPGLTDKVKFIQLATGPGLGEVLLHTLNKSAKGELDSFRWTGSEWSHLGTVAEKVAGSNKQECFMAAVTNSLVYGAPEYEVTWRP
jgi:hypothetical protein